MVLRPVYLGIDVERNKVNVAVLPGGRTWPFNYGKGIDEREMGSLLGSQP